MDECMLLLMHYNHEKLRAILQLNNKVGAGRFNTEVFVNCLSLSAVNKDHWVETFCPHHVVKLQCCSQYLMIELLHL